MEKAAIADSQLGAYAEGVVEPDTREVGLAALDWPNRAVGSVPKADTDRVGIPVRARGGRPRPELWVADELDDLTLPVEGAVHVRAGRWERKGGLERRVCRLRNSIRQGQLVKERWVCAGEVERHGAGRGCNASRKVAAFRGTHTCGRADDAVEIGARLLAAAEGEYALDRPAEVGRSH